MEKSKKAESLFYQNLNCAQSVLMTFGPELGLNEGLCIKITEAFGGGVAHQGKTCGAIIGALMVLGLRYGRGTIIDINQQEKVDKLAKIFIKKFEEKFYYTNCKELINVDISTKDRLEKARETNIFKNCGGIVKTTVEIIEGIMD